MCTQAFQISLKKIQSVEAKIFNVDLARFSRIRAVKTKIERTNGIEMSISHTKIIFFFLSSTEKVYPKTGVLHFFFIVVLNNFIPSVKKYLTFKKCSHVCNLNYIYAGVKIKRWFVKNVFL